MDLSTITVSDFKALFVRDFIYSASDSNYVLDADITRAFGEATALLNQALYPSDAIIQMSYLYLTAHYLCLDLRAASQNIEGAGFFPVNARSVGSVSESYTIPEAYTNSPLLSIYSQTPYGMKFLSITLPSLVGNVISVYGGTSA